MGHPRFEHLQGHEAKCACSRSAFGGLRVRKSPSWLIKRKAGSAPAFGVVEENAHGGGTAGAEFGSAGSGDYLRSQQGYRAVGERPQGEDEGDVIF
jgi:hypothetical protein